MEKTIQNIPFLRLAIVLALGIFTGSIVQLQIHMYLVITIIVLIIAILIIKRLYNPKIQAIYGLTINLLFLFLGIYVYHSYNKKPVFFENGKFVATILEPPKEKTNSFETTAKIISFIRNDSLFTANEQTLIYFSKENDPKNLHPGSIIVFSANPQFIKNFGNPYEFNYRKYLERKKIYRQIYLGKDNWINTGYYKNSISVLAEKERQRLLNIYKKLPIGEQEVEILSALTLGYKRNLDPETKQVFSSAGAMHVLAVSGLHVGIIFWIIILLFGYLRRQKTGRLIFTVISILSLWSYAFITGLSPSVLRASVMFSIFIVGESLQRKSNVYNSLAASAFFLLLINPNNLFETGFQLSYSAVFGILYLQPKIGSVIKVKNKILLFFWNLLTVSFAAQITTVPFILYYFGQFPSYFWLTNIIIIPAVMVLIPLGILLFCVSGIPILAHIIASALNIMIKGVLFQLKFIEQLPYAVFHVSFSLMQLFIVILTLYAFFVLLKTRRNRYLHFTLFGILILTTTFIYRNINNLNKRELIVYNNEKNATLELIHGKMNFIISEKEIKPDSPIQSAVMQTTQKRNLELPFYYTVNDTIVNRKLFLENGVVYFEGKQIVFGEYQKYSGKYFHPDLIINPVKPNEINLTGDKTAIVITNKRFIPEKNEDKTGIYTMAFKASYRKIW